MSHINGIQNEKREREDIPAGFLVGVFKSKAGVDFRSSKKNIEKLLLSTPWDPGESEEISLFSLFTPG